uniref:Uncharacterized protein n=1 Tax=Arion vulgaris TaxID=1028688 RepID=A0A0B6ZDN8_9EUPU
MTSKGNKRVENKDSLSNQHHDQTVDKRMNKSLIIQDGKNKENVQLSSKDTLTTTNKKVVRKSYNPFTFCTKSESVAVKNLNSTNEDGDHRGDTNKVTVTQATDELSDAVMPSASNITSQTTSRQQLQSTMTQVDENTAMKNPKRRQIRNEELLKSGNVVHENMQTESRKKKYTPDHKKSKKKGLNTNEDIQLVYASQIASLNTPGQVTDYKGVATLDSQPTVEEENDLLENAEMERTRNKQRVRAKKMKENKHLSPAKTMTKLEIAYQNAQREIDKVLQPIEIENDARQKKDKVKQRTDLTETHGEDNEAYSSSENDSLEKAREKMHKLLDDAFMVISDRKPSTSKVEPTINSSSEGNSMNSPNRIEQMVQTDASMNYEKKHSPMQVYPSRKLHDEAGLITYSPYRAFDDTELIAQTNALTYLNATPAEEPFSLNSKYYATEPGEPIIIKTRNMKPKLLKNNSEWMMTPEKDTPTSDRQKRPPLNATLRNPVTIQNSVFDRTLPSQSVVLYPNSSYQYSSSQDVQTSVPKQNVGNRQNYNSSVNDTIQLEDMTWPEEGGAVSNKYDSKNSDVVDVIKESIQPGVSPQPLISSIRKELQALSNKRLTETNNNATK